MISATTFQLLLDLVQSASAAEMLMARVLIAGSREACVFASQKSSFVKR
jgi:hypothetical protein